MPSIWTMGEILVEIMRPRPGMQLYEAGEFLGPYPSGAPAIFIDTVARLGLDAGIIGGVGADDFGRCVLDRLTTDGVDCHRVLRTSGGATAVAFVTYFDDGSRKFIYHIDGTPAVRALAPDGDGLRHIDLFHVMGCSLMTNDDFRGHILDAMQSFHRLGARVSFDPNIRPELLGSRSLDEVVGPVMNVCNVLLPGVAELALLGGSQDVQENVGRLFAGYPLEIIVLKRGRQGCSVYTRDEAIDVPAYLVDEVDPTGAGDCFDAGFLCGLLEGKPIDECAHMAAAAGALNAMAFGPMEGNISRHTLAALMAGNI
ncbi:MAG: sugar kinase [Caldilineaceae bacterium]